jgi:hypothetical protein
MYQKERRARKTLLYPIRFGTNKKTLSVLKLLARSEVAAVGGWEVPLSSAMMIVVLI